MSIKITLIAALVVAIASAAEMKTVKLPEVSRQGGKPLMEALSLRRTTREFNAQKTLSDTVLGELLWAANGLNREDKRTAPTARNCQEIELYVIKADGTWFYDAKKHSLVQKNAT
ncbi:MAG: nitroreductase family protein, partial [Victivallales bacterium]|nr:nitroreductase family protein [Victivallales bacterium]